MLPTSRRPTSQHEMYAHHSWRGKLRVAWSGAGLRTDAATAAAVAVAVRQGQRDGRMKGAD